MIDLIEEELTGENTTFSLSVMLSCESRILISVLFIQNHLVRFQNTIFLNGTQIQPVPSVNLNYYIQELKVY